jgi:hypothetical protein
MKIISTHHRSIAVKADKTTSALNILLDKLQFETGTLPANNPNLNIDIIQSKLSIVQTNNDFALALNRDIDISQRALQIGGPNIEMQKNLCLKNTPHRSQRYKEQRPKCFINS